MFCYLHSILMRCNFYAHRFVEIFRLENAEKISAWIFLLILLTCALWVSRFFLPFLPSLTRIFFSTSIVEEKHFPSERARNKWKFFPSRWCRSFFFPFALCRKIINGRKLRKLCNIFIKFFAVACNFSEKGKVFLLCDVAYGKTKKKNGN